jgi:hypothetical protein
MATPKKLDENGQLLVKQCHALGQTVAECNEILSEAGLEEISGANYSYYKQRYAEEIKQLRGAMDENVKDHFPLARLSRRIHELTLLYNRAKDFEDDLTFSGKESEGRRMLKESIETRAKILKQIQDEIEPLRIAGADGKPLMGFVIDPGKSLRNEI